jgi:putative phage-type endonuclease
MKIIECEQGTPEWHAARCGRVTASRVADIVRKTKTGVSKMRETYAGELVAERLSGVQEEGFVSKPMQWGKETEDQARKVYALMHDVDPVRVGFVVHSSIDMAGASPDSLIAADGGLEIKCPNCSTHIATLRGAPIDPDYAVQLQWNMACAGRSWWDFASFDPRFPAEMQLHVRRVHRDPIMIAELEHAVRIFLGEVDEAVVALRRQYQPAEAA